MSVGRAMTLLLGRGRDFPGTLDGLPGMGGALALCPHASLRDAEQTGETCQKSWGKPEAFRRAEPGGTLQVPFLQ